VNQLDYYLTKVCLWFAHFTYVVANSTGCNPTYVKLYYNEWQEWVRYFELLEIHRRGVK
jgi:hypothetical protein